MSGKARTVNGGRRMLCVGLVSVVGALGTLVVAPAHADDTTPLPPNVQSAVDRGLDWLARQQDSGSGAWSGGESNSTAVGSLAIMAFLARGHTPGSGQYGENINKGVDWVLAQQRPNGLMASSADNDSMYNHGISTVMLTEVYGMLDDGRQKKVEAALSKAIQLILDAQKVQKGAFARGGWRYRPESTDSDLSVTGWQLMALRGAANVGAAVPPQAIADAVAYVRRCANVNGGFAYGTGGGDGPTPTRTGIGILSLELLGQHGTREAVAGGDYLLRTPLGHREFANNFYWYGVYYCSQAAYQLGDRYWDGIYRPIRDRLITTQQASGAWPVGSDTDGTKGGNVYTTSMAILALTVPYRYLPLYQR